MTYGDLDLGALQFTTESTGSPVMIDHRDCTDPQPPAAGFTPDLFEAPETGPLTLALYPELAPVIALAVDAVIYTFDIDRSADAALIADLERVAVSETLATYAPMAAIAAQASRSAGRAGHARTAAVAKAAEAMAACTAEVAAVLQVCDEAHAVRVARDASDAAELVAASVGFEGGARRVAATAAQLATAVRLAAADVALERARAAALVAQAASAAAAEVAQTAELMSVAVELEVFNTAAAVRAIALDTCYQAAVDVAATTAELALSDRAPV